MNFWENIFLSSMGDTDFWVPKDKPIDLLRNMRRWIRSYEARPSEARRSDHGRIQHEKSVSQWYGCLYCVRLFGIFESVGKWWDLEWSSTFKPETLSMMRTSQLADGVKVAFPMWSMPGTGFGLGFARQKGRACSRLGRIPLGRHGWYSLAGCRLELNYVFAYSKDARVLASI